MNSQITILNKKKKVINKNSCLFMIFLLIALIVWVSVIFLGNNTYADGSAHIRQIHRFIKGNYHLMSQITTIPGYHITVAFIASFFHHLNARQIHLISLALSLITIPIFYLIAKKFQAKNSLLKTLQYIFFPLTFFYFPLLYTDIFSLLIVLIAFYFVLSKRYWLSSLFSFLSLLVRQTNIVWVVFFWVYTYILENKFKLSLNLIFSHLRRGIGYVITSILFFLFVLINHGVSIGDRVNQQIGFYMGNIYFFLFLSGLLFLPIIIGTYFKKPTKFIFKKNIIWGIIIGLILVLLFIFSPLKIHKYNLKMSFLRNIILSFAYHKYAWAYAGSIFIGTVTLALMKFKENSFILFPFIFICLAPSLLVEQRYTIIPMVFILLFREELDFKSEFIIMLYFFLFSIGLEYMLLYLEIFF